MLQHEIMSVILENHTFEPKTAKASSYAPSNIALIKYWGKRDSALNLPMTDSLSISLANKGASTEIKLSQTQQDHFYLNGELQKPESSFSQRLSNFLNFFRFSNHCFYEIHTHLNIPLAAGLASSACGFAALVKALDQFYGWNLSPERLSVLARLGSGSACRSIYSGFVWWQKGIQKNGMDSYAIPITTQWPDLRIGLLIINKDKKALASREAMERTLKTSYLYENWPQQVAHDLNVINEAILSQDFTTLGQVSEHNALSMHATMISAWPAIIYSTAETLAAIHKIARLRQEGLGLYFTQDAGPNLKLLFLAKDQKAVLEHFPDLEIIAPFGN